MKRTPLRRKRLTPRRSAPERVQHVRTKPRAGAPPTAAEKRHIERVAAMPCLVSGDPATVHHVTGYADRIGRFSRSHRLVVPLAPQFHQHDFGSKSVERLNHRGFYREHGIDLLAEAERLWRESEALEVGAVSEHLRGQPDDQA
jgi:hypothetical protein